MTDIEKNIIIEHLKVMEREKRRLQELIKPDSQSANESKGEGNEVT